MVCSLSFPCKSTFSQQNVAQTQPQPHRCEICLLYYMQGLGRPDLISFYVSGRNLICLPDDGDMLSYFMCSLFFLYEKNMVQNFSACLMQRKAKDGWAEMFTREPYLSTLYRPVVLLKPECELCPMQQRPPLRGSRTSQ